MIVELTPEALTLLGAAVSVVGGAVAYAFARKDRFIDKLEKEIAAYRLREDARQDREIESLHKQLDVSQNTTGAHQYLARSLEDQTTFFKDQRLFFAEILARFKERQ